MGGYISFRHKTTEQALECSMGDDEQNCSSRNLRPDDDSLDF